VIVKNLTQNIVLSLQADLADTILSRMQGLLGRKTLEQGRALIITQCNSIHMFFMKFPIDAIFIDRAGCVVGCVKNIKPFQMSPLFWTAERVVELPAGTIDRTATALGDILEIK
jgi:uncharacterized membrane protein (UPF0127 family)